MTRALFLSLFLLAGLAQAEGPADASPGAPEPPPHELHTLSNGLRVVLAPQPHLGDMVSVHVVYEVGSRDEGQHQRQLAHLTEHAMFRGSAHAGDFPAEIDALGGVYSAETWPDRTHYAASVPTAALDRLLWLEADRMGALPAGLRPIEVELEREIVRSEGRWRTDELRASEFELGWTEATWPEGHPYHRSPRTDYASLDTFDREAVVAFWTQHYGPQRAVLVVAGPIDTETTLAMVKQRFGAIPRRGADRAPMQPNLAAAEPASIRQDGKSSVLRYTWRLPPDHPDLAAIAAFASIPPGLGAHPLDEIDQDDDPTWSYGASLAYSTRSWVEEAVVTATFWFAPVTDLALVRERVATWWAQRCEAPFDDQVMGVLHSEEARSITRSPHGTAKMLGAHYAAGRSREQLGGWSQALLATTGTSVCEAAKRSLRLDDASEFLSEARLGSGGGVSGLGLGGSSQSLYDDSPEGRRLDDLPPAGTWGPLDPSLVTSFVHRTGARVFLMPADGVVSFRLLVHGAPLAEGTDSRGVSFLAAGAVVEGAGTAKHKALMESLDAWGRGVTASVDDRAVWLESAVSREDFTRLAEELKSKLARPDLDAANRGRWSRYHRQRRGGTTSIEPFAWEKLRRAVMRGHPSQGPPAGSAWSMKQSSKKDVRTHLTNWFRPEDFVVLVSGPITREQLEVDLDTMLGKSKGTPSPPWGPKAAQPPGQPEILLIDRDEGEQTLLLYGSVAPVSGRDTTPAGQVASVILGDGLGSRLGQLLRGSLGSTYGVQSSYTPLPGSGFFALSTAVDRDATREAIGLLLAEIDGMRTRLAATPGELERAKGLLEGRLRNQLGSAWGRVEAMQDLLAWGFNPAKPNEWIEALRAVTADDVAVAAQSMANIQAMSLVVVAPADTYEEELAAFGMPVRVLRP